MIRVAIAAAVLLFSSSAAADAFMFAGGAFTRVVSGGGTVAVPSVIGEADFAAADMILEGDGLDGAEQNPVCSNAPADEIVGQDPPPGTLVASGAIVAVTPSSGAECKGSSGGLRPKVRLGL